MIQANTYLFYKLGFQQQKSKLCILTHCVWGPPMASEFPSQRASNV